MELVGDKQKSAHRLSFLNHPRFVYQMKKTLLAAALLAGFAGAASAQSSVTLYGIIDAALSYTNYSYTNNSGNSVGDSQFGVRTQSQSGNRWGFKGVEDLGGGNQVIFNLEAGFNGGNGQAADSTRAFNRLSWFGVQKACWGNIKFGRHNSIAWDYQGVITDPFAIANSQVSSNTTLTWNSGRYDNLLSYETPVLSGFQAKVGYSFAAGQSSYYQNGTSYTAGSGSATYNFNTQNNMTALNAGIKYSNGPLYLVATYDQINPNQNIVSGLNSVSGLIIGGYYDFEVVKVYANYGHQSGGLIGGGNQQMVGISTSDITDAASNSTGSVIFAPGVSVNSYDVGISAPIGANGKVLALWQLSQPNGTLNGLASTYGVVSTANENVYGVGYSYNFSKRTNMYAFASYASNYAMVSGLNSTQVSVGLRHIF